MALIVVSPAEPSVVAPTLGTPSMGSTTASIAFSGGSGYTTLIPQYRETGAGSWTSLSSDTSSPLSYTGLTAETGYDFRALADGTVASNTVTGTTGSASSPAYTPARLMSFEGGTLGAVADGANAFVSAMSNTLYSNDVAGPLGGSRVCHIEGQNLGGTVFGGLMAQPNIRPAEGTGCWIRIWHYFPDTFCFQNNGAGDAWGQTKWIRLQWGDGGVRMTFQVGNYSSSACNSYGTMWGATDEGVGGTLNLTFTSPLQIPRGGWRCLEWHVHFSTDAETGYIEGWVGDDHSGRVYCQTLPSSSGLELEELIYGDYINGGHILDNPWYIDEGIITFETPDAVDSGGRPRIGTARATGDFA